MSYYNFSTNILKRSVKSLHQMNIIVLYKFIRRELPVNAKGIIQKIVKKTQFYHFFILYDNMNFYTHVLD